MRIVITGASGLIGKEIVEDLSEHHELCLLDCKPFPNRTSIIADLTKYNDNTISIGYNNSKLKRWSDAFKEAEAVVHLAKSTTSNPTLQQTIHNDMQLTWNVFQAAIKHRIRRLVYASSNWAVKALELELAPACYKSNGPKIGSDAYPRPKTYYGITKACGEITGRMMVDDKELNSFVAVRIGSYNPNPTKGEHYRQLGITKNDLCSLFRSCIEAKFEGFHVVYGVSAQKISPYDLSYTTRLLSWKPKELP
jgi:uronate dehydrogenase